MKIPVLQHRIVHFQTNIWKCKSTSCCSYKLFFSDLAETAQIPPVLIESYLLPHLYIYFYIKAFCTGYGHCKLLRIEFPVFRNYIG